MFRGDWWKGCQTVRCDWLCVGGEGDKRGIAKIKVISTTWRCLDTEKKKYKSYLNIMAFNLFLTPPYTLTLRPREATIQVTATWNDSTSPVRNYYLESCTAGWRILSAYSMYIITRTWCPGSAKPLEILPGCLTIVERKNPNCSLIPQDQRIWKDYAAARGFHCGLRVTRWPLEATRLRQEKSNLPFGASTVRLSPTLNHLDLQQVTDVCCNRWKLT